MTPKKHICSLCHVPIPPSDSQTPSSDYCPDCIKQKPELTMNHDSTSDVIGFSSDWFDDNDIFDEFPGT